MSLSFTEVFVTSALLERVLEPAPNSQSILEIVFPFYNMI